MYSPIIWVRVVHIAAAIFNLLFVYTTLHDWPHGFRVVQTVSMPLLLLSGALMVRDRKKGRATN